MLRIRKREWLTILLTLLISWAGLIPISSGFAASKSNTVVWNKNSIQEVQKDLQSNGYYHGQIDGLMGPQTRAAIRQYQKSEHLPVTGRLDAATAGKLGVEPSSAGAAFKSAETSVEKGGKEFGHAIEKGKPVKAGKELGQSLGHAGKETGKGVKKAVTP